MAEATTAEGAKTGVPAREKIARKVNWIVVGAGLGLVAVVVAAVFGSFWFVEDQRDREIRAWQVRLGIVADSRKAAVDDWIEGNFAALRELAENASLQLYMTELDLSGGDRSAVTDEPAQASYLRNLLVAAAERTGFKPPPTVGEVAANIERAGVAGLGLADKNGKPIVSTPQMPPFTGAIRTAVAKALEGEPQVIDIYMGATNLSTIGFVLPVIGLQADRGSAAIGAVIGVRIVDKTLFDRLRQPGSVEETAETYLVRKSTSGAEVEYLSPLARPDPPRSLPFDPAKLDAAIAVENPGGFTVSRDYAGNEVLVTSRSVSVANLRWSLVRKIDRSEALGAVETRLRTLLIVFVLIIVGVAVTVIAVWRHGTSVRAAEAAERFRISSERFENISKFMRLVTNSQPNAIVAVDGTTTYTFANEPAARAGGIAPEDMLGKTMASVMGPVKAKTYAQINDQVLREFETYETQQLPDSRERARRSEVHTFEGEGDKVEVVKSDHIPLRGDRDHPPGVLVVLSDITELTTERRRSEHMTRQLINTMVDVVDRRDPYSAKHSARTAEVARCIAAEMELPEADVKTVDFAASLLSLGKIFVPIELLAKGEDQMTADEHRQVVRAHLTTAEILNGVPFEGPVVETIRQSGEAWDGSGPLGLEGEAILMTARVVAVANQFVRKVSARAYRDGVTFEEVSNQLLRDSGTKYDRRPVSALINHLDNRGGATKWAHFRERPAASKA